MDKMQAAEIFPRAPDYGRGMARRRIRLTGGPRQVLGELEDHAHGMRCLIEHDGAVITAVSSEFRRFPMNTCAGAGEHLPDLVGTPVGSSFGDFYRDGRSRMNCTHMFDIAWLATAHAARGEVVRTYDIEVPDDVNGASDVRLLRDGEVRLRWSVRNSVVQSPEAMAGQHLFKGFTTWALAHLHGDDLEAALVLQKGCFVAQARRWAIVPGPISAAERNVLAGVCHGFGHARVDEAARLEGTKRDFTEHPDRLLRFL